MMFLPYYNFLFFGQQFGYQNVFDLINVPSSHRPLIMVISEIHETVFNCCNIILLVTLNAIFCLKFL